MDIDRCFSKVPQSIFYLDEEITLGAHYTSVISFIAGCLFLLLAQKAKFLKTKDCQFYDITLIFCRSCSWPKVHVLCKNSLTSKEISWPCYI